MAPIRLQRTTVRTRQWRVASLLRTAGAIFCALAAGLAILAPARATTPSYSVSVGGGSVSPNPICDGVPGTATLSGSLTIGNPNNEYSISNQSWSWSASVTAYAPNSTSTYGSLSGVTAPSVSISGSSSGTLTVTAGPSTSPGDYQISVTATDSFTQTDNTTHPATLTNQTPSGNTTVTVVNVTIGGVQYNDPTNGWTALPSELDAMAGTSVSLKALPTPSDASFPSSMPIWSGLASGSGTTATASYSGQSTSVGDETIKVRLGTVSNGRSSTATTFNLTPKMQPTVSWAGRDVSQLGVGESGTLNFTVAPVATPMPGLQWSRTGSGSLPDDGTTNEIGSYWAGVTAGSATIKLNVTTGPSAGKASSPLTETIVAPQNPAVEIKDTSVPDYHINGDASAGFEGIIQVLPSAVCFSSVLFGETNEIPSSGSTNLELLFKNTPHMPGNVGDSVVGPLWHTTQYGNCPLGVGTNSPPAGEDECRVDLVPAIGLADSSTSTTLWTVSDLTYSIPWIYAVDNPYGPSAVVSLCTVQQTFHIDAAGSTTVTKTSATSTVAVGAATFNSSTLYPH